MSDNPTQQPATALVPTEVRIGGFDNGRVTVTRGANLRKTTSGQSFDAHGASLSDPISWTVNAAPVRAIKTVFTSPVTFHIEIQADNVQSAFNGTLTAKVTSNPNVNKIYVFAVSVRDPVTGAIEDPPAL